MGKEPIYLSLEHFFIYFFVLVGISKPKVEFFPDNDPAQIIVYIQYPEGTDIEKTNSITKKIEKTVIEIINNKKYVDNDYNFMVESLVSQVGAERNPETDSGSEAEMPNRGKSPQLRESLNIVEAFGRKFKK